MPTTPINRGGGFHSAKPPVWPRRLPATQPHDEGGENKPANKKYQPRLKHLDDKPSEARIGGRLAGCLHRGILGCRHRRSVAGARPDSELTGDDPMQSRPDIDFASRLLDWEPRVPLRSGLEQTIAYFRQLAP